MSKLQGALKAYLTSGRIADLAASPMLPIKVRRKVLRRAGLNVGEGTVIFPDVRFIGRDVTIGSGSFINAGCFFDAGPITVGNKVALGPNVVLASGTHEIGPSSGRAGKNLWQPVVVEDGCWIGANATILGNVTVARGCIIAAGAVVTKSTEPDGLYAGVPAKRIKDLPVDA